MLRQVPQPAQLIAHDPVLPGVVGHRATEYLVRSEKGGGEAVHKPDALKRR